MIFQRIRRTVLTAMLLAGSAAIALAQTGDGGDNTSKPGTAAGNRGSGATGTPSAVDTTGMGGSHPGCSPSPGGSPVTGAERPPGSASGGPQAPRITNDPTVATSESTETGLGTDAVTPKNPKTGKLADC